MPFPLEQRFAIVISPPQESVCIMLYGLFICHSETACELFIRYISRISLICIQLRNVPFYEKLQISDVHKGECVRDNPADEFIILLIALQLCLPIRFSSNDNVIKPHAVIQDRHIRMEAKLPA